MLVRSMICGAETVCLSDHHATTARLCSPERHPRPDTPARFTRSPSPTQYVITSHAWIDTITTAPVCYFHRGRRTEGRTFGGGERSEQVRVTQGLHLLLPPPHHLPQRKVILLLRCSSKKSSCGIKFVFPSRCYHSATYPRESKNLYYEGYISLFSSSTLTGGMWGFLNLWL